VSSARRYTIPTALLRPRFNLHSGPVISPAAKEKIEGLIASCEEEGGKILLDGRGHKVVGYPEGNWVGPTVLEAKEGMKCHE
jgi:malonate-semialdehyde dehydrogenase (acetylating)/methylmalonate-semialdehyde dehydrogenase